jgi:hypothetical protein
LSVSRVCFNSKDDSKIAKAKIATKIDGFYSINFVESNGESKIAKSKIATKIEGFYSYKVQLLKVWNLKTNIKQLSLSFANYFNKQGRKPQTGSSFTHSKITKINNARNSKIYTESHDFTGYFRFCAILLGFCFELEFYSGFRSFRVSKIHGFHNSTCDFDNNVYNAYASGLNVIAPQSPRRNNLTYIRYPKYQNESRIFKLKKTTNSPELIYRYCSPLLKYENIFQTYIATKNQKHLNSTKQTQQFSVSHC